MLAGSKATLQGTSEILAARPEPLRKIAVGVPQLSFTKEPSEGIDATASPSIDRRLTRKAFELTGVIRISSASAEETALSLTSVRDAGTIRAVDAATRPFSTSRRFHLEFNRCFRLQTATASATSRLRFTPLQHSVPDLHRGGLPVRPCIVRNKSERVLPSLQ